MMKKILILVFTLVAHTIYSQIQTPTCDYLGTQWAKKIIYRLNCENFEAGNWTLVFNDEFDGNQVDVSKWYTCSDGWSRTSGGQLDYILDNNTSVNNGVLEITAKYQPGYYEVIKFDENGNSYTENEFFSYTSGMIQSKMNFKYGLFEARVWIPEGKALWPSFWLWGPYGYQNIGTEIDIFEFKGQTPKKHEMTLHRWGVTNADHDQCATDANYGIDFSKGWHTFSAEWDEFKIVYRVDGSIKRIDYTYMSMVPQGLWDCQHHVSGFYLENPYKPIVPCNVRFGLGVADSEHGGPPDANTVFPSVYKIDYIRIYRRNNSDKEIEICKLDLKDISSVQTGNSITIGNPVCNSTLHDKEFLYLFAANNITLQPGFQTENGANFSAKLYSNKQITLTNNPTINFEQINFKNSDELQLQSNNFSSVKDIGYDIINIYPNPGSDNLNIELYGNTDDFINIEIFSLTGNLMQNITHFENTIFNIDVSNYPNGIYIIKFKTSNQILTKKYFKVD